MTSSIKLLVIVILHVSCDMPTFQASNQIPSNIITHLPILFLLVCILNLPLFAALNAAPESQGVMQVN